MNRKVPAILLAGLLLHRLALFRLSKYSVTNHSPYKGVLDKVVIRPTK